MGCREASDIHHRVGRGTHTIYIWLKDNVGNVNNANRAVTYLYFDNVAMEQHCTFPDLFLQAPEKIGDLPFRMEWRFFIVNFFMAGEYVSV
jgi:hypothetical protein